jgi:hypothetical protein
MVCDNDPHVFGVVVPKANRATARCHSAAENSSIRDASASGSQAEAPRHCFWRSGGSTVATMACLPRLPARRSTKCQARNMER